VSSRERKIPHLETLRAIIVKLIGLAAVEPNQNEIFTKGAIKALGENDLMGLVVAAEMGGHGRALGRYDLNLLVQNQDISSRRY
jgi:hypothetical protein